MPPESDDEPETYDGPLELRHGDTSVTVAAHLSGFFQPIDGEFRWHGRLDPDEELTALARSAGRKEVDVRRPGAEAVRGKLGETNPWGGYRISGRGWPPF